ncbi:tripartite tricarboxylate transporter TctB family protein [Mesorhizobium sp. CN2-181]|uniref:tripartite tricarboxylate transporter TctB family protein n=1 Tax=Mesorhizobium yinganensis TaxID=3157707 RepID=UPI0032B79FD6
MSLNGGPREERRPDRAALIIAIVLVLAGLGMGWGTFASGGVSMNTPVGPKTVPYIIAGALVLLGLLTAVAAMRGDFPERERQDFPPMLWIIGGLAVQLLTMKSIGFSIATGLLFAATAKGFGKGPLWKTIPIGIVFSFAVWLLFAKGLQLTLPAGPLERLF